MAVARSPLVALRYAMYFRFINDVMFAHNGQKLAKKAFSKLLTSTDLTPQTTLKVTHQGQHRTGDGVCYLRVAFKLIATVHRCLNGRAPNYLLNRVIPVSAIVSRQRLRSAQQNTLVGPTLQTDHIRPSSIFCCGSHSMEQSSCFIQRPDNQRCLLPTAFKDSSVRTTASAP